MKIFILILCFFFGTGIFALAMCNISEIISDIQRNPDNKLYYILMNIGAFLALSSAFFIFCAFLYFLGLGVSKLYEFLIVISL